ncbi:MAG: nitroreductase family deazaflavin-dependent oxidoreductase [Solirubrobacterales bacterium]
MKPPPAPQADSRFWTLWRGLTELHTGIYKLSRGRIGGTSQGAPVLLLEHVGRKSGKERTNPLICTEDGNDLIVIASKGGIEKHPAWYLNLMANPETDVWWRGRKRRVRAREASGEERERLWQKMVGVYAPYADYQRRTDRQIPVIVLEPAA